MALCCLLGRSGRTRWPQERLLGPPRVTLRQLADARTLVKQSVFVDFSESARTADAQPLGARLGALLCLLLAFWGAL